MGRDRFDLGQPADSLHVGQDPVAVMVPGGVTERGKELQLNTWGSLCFGR